MPDIAVTLAQPGERRARPASDSDLPFGKIFTDHVFSMKYAAGKGWHDAAIRPYAALALDPASTILHYGQGVFEGMKAFCGADKDLYLYRPESHIRRLNVSAQRLCIPPLDPDFVLKAIQTLVMLDKDWMPETVGTALYIRPFIMGVDNYIGVKAASEYLFNVLLCPVGAYYREGFGPTKILVTEDYARAALGGTGACKVIGNYAASLLAAEMAHSKGYSQVLWLDSATKKMVEEVGMMNVFFHINDRLVTPRLNGSILPGITRDSILTLAREKGLAVDERDLSIEEVIRSIENGSLKECFGSGTAAVVSPVSTLGWRDRDYTIGSGRAFPLAEQFFKDITDLQYGRTTDTHGWGATYWE